MLGEVLEGLKPRDGGRYVDGTVGGGGHAESILRSSAPTGWLFGCDRDGAAIEAASKRLAAFAGRFELRRGNFADLDQWVEAGSCDGVVLDLGVSSPQLDTDARGFSFLRDGALDMRMDTRQELTAAMLVNKASEEDLSRLFWELGQERMARRFAREVARERERHPFQTTRQLAGLIERLSPPGRHRIHPATRVFQALRMRVNDETGALERGLQAAWTLLKPNGRMAVITFHSIEAKWVKEFGRAKAREYDVIGDVDVPELRRERKPEMRWITRKPIEPGETELNENPRSRSAQLRVMERI